MSLRPPHLQNGWGSSLGQRVKQQQQQMPPRKSDIQMANPNMNNNNNNNNSNNANAGNEYCSNYIQWCAWNARNINVWFFSIQCWKVQLVKVHRCVQA